jgi:hypothetical protein
MNTKGHTLIELIIYLGLVSLVFTGSIVFLLELIQVKEKSLNMNFDNLASLYSLGRGNYLSTNANTAQEFTTDMALESFDFTDMSEGNTAHAKMSSSKLESSWEIQNPSLQARYLLVNLIFGSMTSSGKDLSGISLRNIKATSVEIDEIYLEWRDVSSEARVTEVQIGGSSVEWSGSEASPASLDINNFTIQPDQSVSIDFIRFNTQMGGGYLIMEIIMADGSSMRSELDLLEQEGEGGTAPPPCSLWCMEEDYAYGVCRSSSLWCWLYGEEYESEANSLCTGGSSADTCCCHD